MNTQNEMKVESIKEEKDKVVVVTTGAKYIIDKSGDKGKIYCRQRLNKKRLITAIEFNFPFSTLSLEGNDETTCVFHQQLGEGSDNYLRLQINSDSVLDVYSLKELNLTFAGHFLADYSAQKNGHILLIDQNGGAGFYPCEGLRNMEFNGFTTKEWRINYSFDKFCRLLVSIFPPRKLNRKPAGEDSISHHGSINPEAIEPYPSNVEIEEARKYTNILVLHEGIWHGKYTRNGRPVKTSKDVYDNASYCCYNYVPVDERQLLRVVKKAHSLGMRVIPYMSPFYSMAKGSEFLERVERVLDRYGFDGVYYDAMSADILYSYEMIRATRKLLKDKIIYLHCTSYPLMSRDIFCPFIDTYADYILKAEHVTKFNDQYLRYVLSAYNISNAIGYICYFNYPIDFIRELIPKALKFNVRFYLGLPETEREKLLKKEYFSKLE